MKRLVPLTAAMLAVTCSQSENGLLSTNQFVPKSFLIRPSTSTQQDPGWIGKATFTQVATPNPLGSRYFNVSPGVDSGAILFRWVVTEDTLQMVSTRTVEDDSGDVNVTNTVVDSWPATSVDMSAQTSSQGEPTSISGVNENVPWENRAWVELSFAKSDLSDVAPFGSFLQAALNQCTTASQAAVTLVPGSFSYSSDSGNPDNDYMQFAVSVTVPLNFASADCVTAFGTLGSNAQSLGHTTATFNIMYSMVRAKALNDPNQTYVPLSAAEMDPIRHKYGFFETHTFAVDPNTNLPTSQAFVNRFDPQKPIVWYFEQGFPDEMKPAFDTIAQQTNTILTAANVKARVSFADYDANLATGQSPRQYGDIRYNFVLWLSDDETESSFVGVAPSVNDPRTGETISASIALSNFSFQSQFVQRIDAFLQSIGASSGIDSSGEWPTAPPGESTTCQVGQTVPIVNSTVLAQHNGQSTVYQDMQSYLYAPAEQLGPLGPQNFIVQQDDDFYHAFYALLPYQVYADPATNPFTIPVDGTGAFGPAAMATLLDEETQFQAAAAGIDQGTAPYAGTDISGALSFLNNFRTLTEEHRNYLYSLNFATSNQLGMRLDTSDILDLEQVADVAARQCISVDGNGQWETKEEWEQNLETTFWSQVSFHELGHALGLTHNFMGSVDREDFPPVTGSTQYAAYSSSVMEYNSAMAAVASQPQWGPYDQGALAWIYGNNTSSYHGTPSTTAISGQSSATSPWKDPLGFSSSGQEKPFLMCNEYDERYTPFCRRFDLGSSPSEIIANQLDAYEWQYQWRNFPTYNTIWDDSTYADAPIALYSDLRRFMSLWLSDWSSGQLPGTLTALGINASNSPETQLQGTPNAEYLTQLTNKFDADISMANQLAVAYALATVEQTAAQRPYQTVASSSGNITQQGIILDKLFATQGLTALWPSDDYTPNAGTTQLAAYQGFGDAQYNAVADNAAVTLVGGNYAAYPYFQPLALVQFWQDTHSPEFSGPASVANWAGGQSFTSIQGFLSFFQELAIQNAYVSADGTVNCSVGGTKNLCTVGSCLTNVGGGYCSYDPRLLSNSENELVGPDGNAWIWSFEAGQNQWVAMQQAANVASYGIAQQFNEESGNLGDGNVPSDPVMQTLSALLASPQAN